MTDLSKQAWKTLFESMSDADLRDLAKQTGTKVKGFRDVQAAPRAMLITQMIAPAQIRVIRSYWNQRTQEDDALLAYRGLSKEELLANLQEGASPFDLLLALLSSGESNHMMMGELLLNEIELKGELSELVEAYYAAEKGEPEPETAPEEEPEIPETESDNRILRRLEKKYETLKQQHDKLQSESQEKRKELEQEVKELRNTARDKQRLDGQYQKVLEENQQLAGEKQELQEQFLRHQESFDKLKRENEQLQQDNEQLAAKLQALMQALEEQGGAEVAKQAVSRIGQRPLVLLIGKPSKNNLELQSSVYDIRLLGVDQVEQDLDPLLPEAAQVWMLTYETPFPKQRKIRQRVGPGQLREFKDYQGLKGYLNLNR